VVTLISADLKPDQRPVSGRLLCARLFDYFDLCLYLPDSHQDLVAQFEWRGVASAMLRDDAFHRFLKAVLPQARTALVEVLPDVVAILF